MVIAFAGRRIDELEAGVPRFPASNTELVESRMKALFSALKATALVCSGACGADLLAMKVAKELGMARRLVLPFQAEKFRHTSVADRPGEWGILFDRVYSELKSDGSVVVLENTGDEDEVYLATNLMILDIAEKLYLERKTGEKQGHGKASENITAVVAWEGSPKESGDTTVHFLREAERRKIKVEEINTLY